MSSTSFPKWCVLLGFFKQPEALSYLQSQAVPLSPEIEGGLQRDIAEAREYVNATIGRRGVVPKMREMPEGSKEYLNRLSTHPTFQEHLGGMKSSAFKIVELDNLHCFQPNLNLEYIDYLLEKAPDPDDFEGTLKFCLPTEEKTEEEKTKLLVGFNPTTNTYSIVSENLDLRILGNIQGDDDRTKRKFVGFLFGTGLRQMSVVEYQGIYLLKNGYHRAYALAKKGHKYIPCLLVATDDYQLTGANAPGFFPVDLIMSDKSPILKDYFSKAAVTVPRRRIRVILSIHGEMQVLPT